MEHKIKRILDPETPLRSRLFQLLSTIALTEFVLVSIYTILFSGSIRHIAVMLIGTVLFAVTVSLTFKTGKMQTGPAISGLLYFLMYPLTFYSSGGMYGGAPVVFAFALVYVFLVTQKRIRILCLTVCIAGSAACYLISYLHPELLDRHTVMAEHVESFLSILLVTLLLCTLFAFVTRVYDTENRIVQKQKKEIEELNQAQRRFFSSMSHEIRTPVNAIIGFNEMTLRETISDEVRENAQNIELAGKTLLHTINDILDLSKLETGRMELVESDYPTAAMLSEIVSLTRPRAQEKGLELRLKADPALPSVLHGDEVRIKQILLNLMINAVKYTETGSVTLDAGGRTDEAGTFRMRCDVIDTGIGIRAEDLPRLFTPFARVDEQRTHAIEGTGLGLSIVRQFLDLMGGDVSVSSEYGKGTVFRVEIPQAVADPRPIGEGPLQKAEGPERAGSQSALAALSLKILAVDDTPMNLKVVQKLLRDTGAVIDTAASGRDALQKTLETHYDVILMDHQMPEMDGVECLARIRAQENGMCHTSKVICLTANVGPDIKKLCQETGFDGFLAKPVKGKTLEDEIMRLAANEED